MEAIDHWPSLATQKDNANLTINELESYFYCTWLRALRECAKEMHSPKWRVLSARFSAPAELRQHSMLKALDMAYKKIGEYKNF